MEMKIYPVCARCSIVMNPNRCAVNFRKTTSVNVADPNTVLAWLQDHAHEDCIQYAEPTISKAELAKILKTEAVPGAELVDGYSVGVK